MCSLVPDALYLQSGVLTKSDTIRNITFEKRDLLLKAVLPISYDETYFFARYSFSIVSVGVDFCRESAVNKSISLLCPVVHMFFFLNIRDNVVV